MKASQPGFRPYDSARDGGAGTSYKRQGNCSFDRCNHAPAKWVRGNKAYCNDCKEDTVATELVRDLAKGGKFKLPYTAVIIVSCPDCGIDYPEDEVEVLDIEEGLMGEDILLFNCPKGHKRVKSRRRG